MAIAQCDYPAWHGNVILSLITSHNHTHTHVLSNSVDKLAKEIHSLESECERRKTSENIVLCLCLSFVAYSLGWHSEHTESEEKESFQVITRQQTHFVLSA